MTGRKGLIQSIGRGIIYLILGFLIIQSLAAAAPKKEADTPNTDILRELVKFPHIRIPVVQGRDVQTYYLIEFYVECDTEEAAQKVYKMRPKVIDAVYSDLYGLLSVVWHPDLFIDLKDLKTRIEKVCEKILGKELFEKILIQQFTKTLVKPVKET